MNRFKLLNSRGRIPEQTNCPFKKICPSIGVCHHEGREHKVEFSCATARAFDLEMNSTNRIAKSIKVLAFNSPK